MRRPTEEVLKRGFRRPLEGIFFKTPHYTIRTLYPGVDMNRRSNFKTRAQGDDR